MSAVKRPAVRHHLPGGMTLLTTYDPDSRTVAIVTYVKAGYFDETDDVVGIAHVLEHMFFKGTEKRGVGEVARDTKALGGYLNAHTIYDHTSYYAVLPAHAFERGLEIQADAYRNSVIDAGELSRELEVIIQEAKRKADNAHALAVETLYELLHDRHRIRRWRMGRENELRALTREHLVRFYRTFYGPSNTIVVVAGGVEHERARAAVESAFAGFESAKAARASGPAEESRPGFRYRELAGDVGQSQVVMGWRTPALLHSDTPVLDLLATVLGTGRASRLYRGVRERGLASSVSAGNYTPTELGVFTVHAECDPSKTSACIAGVHAEIAALKEGLVPAHELERARDLFTAHWLRRLETAEGEANYLAEWEAQGRWEKGDEYLAAVRRVEMADLRRIADEYLTDAELSIVTYRPESLGAVASNTKSARELIAQRVASVGPPAAAVQRATRRVAAPEFVTECAGVRVYRTRHGVPVLVRRKPGARFAHLAAFAAVGAANDPVEREGLALLLARSAIKGTATRTAAGIAQDAEALGGSISPSVGGDSLGWSVSVPVSAMDPALELLADVVQRPAFLEDAVANERIVALSDIATLRDDMFAYPLRLAMTAAYAQHPYSRGPLGTVASVPRITVDELRTTHREWVERGAATIAVVGDVDPDAAAREAASAFDALHCGPRLVISAPRWPDTLRTAIESREKAQSALAIALPGPARRAPERFAAGLIARVTSGLGGRFFEELRDRRSLAYTVHSFASPRPLAGTFVAYIATSPEREDEARDSLLDEIMRLRDLPATDEELWRAREYAVGTEIIRRESAGAILGDVVDAWLFGDLSELEEFEQKVRAVTVDDMRGVAETHFDVARRAEGLVRGAGKSV